MSDMTSNRPYLIRAIYEWLNDNAMTPHILVDAFYAGVSVPEEYVQDGRIVLNIAPGAVKEFLADNDGISFNARFAGVPREIYVPADAVLALYARENGQGMAFDPVEPPEPEPTPTEPEPQSRNGRARLKVVK